MNRTARIATVATLALAGLSGGGGAAQASRISIENEVLVLRAEPGEANVVDVREHRANERLLEITDLGSRISTAELFCNRDSASSAMLCGRSRFTSVRLELGDGNDRFATTDEVPIVVDGGAGDDQYSGTDVQVNPFGSHFEAPSQVDFRGGPGRDTAHFANVFNERFAQPGVSVTKDDRANDGRPIDRNNVRGDVEVLGGSAQDDFLSGGPGADEFTSSKGADTIHGLAGDDLFQMGKVRDGATRARGGGGRDTVSYAERTRPVSITLDDDSLRDGESGEGDSIDGAEVVEGGGERDTILTPRATETGYRLIGNDGDDTLEAAAGRDRLIGGRGQDSMVAGPGQDVIEARDGTRDARVDCGSGGSDEALTDFREARPSGCEIARPPQLVGRLGLTAATRARANRIAPVTLSWRHPRSWRRLRSIELRVGGLGRIAIRPRGRRISGDRAIRLAPGAALSRRGRTATVRLQLRLASARARRLQATITAVDTAGRRQVEARQIRVR